MPEVVVRYKAVVSSSTGDDKLGELVWQNGGQKGIKRVRNPPDMQAPLWGKETHQIHSPGGIRHCSNSGIERA